MCLLQSFKAKRMLKETSPDDMTKDDLMQVGNMSISDLMREMKNSMAELLDKKLKNMPTKADLDDIIADVGFLSSKVVELSEENKGLKEKISQLENQHAKEMCEVQQIVNAYKRKSLIIKGLDKNMNPMEAVTKLCSEVLQIESIQIATVKTLFEKNGKRGVAVEFLLEENVFNIFSNIKKLAKTDIFIERDLSTERQLDKRLLLKLKKDIRAADKRLNIPVRDDRMKIGNRWLYWNIAKELRCGEKLRIYVCHTMKY